jgi:hypothetical protein
MDKPRSNYPLPTIIEESYSLSSSTLTQTPIIDDQNQRIKLEKVIETDNRTKKKRGTNRTLIKASQGYKDTRLINPAKVLEEF